MTSKLDYSREDAMQILNNTSYSDEEKRNLYDQYMNNIKSNRKNAIVTKLNEYAKNIPVITKEIYINKLKEYEADDLSKPFEVIEVELSNFEKQMINKYNEYLESQKKVEEPIIETPEEEKQEETFDDTIFSDPLLNSLDEEEEVKPSLVITSEISVINEEPQKKVESLFDDSDIETKDILPDDTEKEKGGASAIIISIIAVIIGILVMYSIIKFN